VAGRSCSSANASSSAISPADFHQILVRLSITHNILAVKAGKDGVHATKLGIIQDGVITPINV
jgi:hypothetical protein